jgi:glycine/D-amino acid oxidase-like deaminating enzyme
VSGLPPERRDLVVVGAGIVGAMVAWQAARRFPDWRLLLVDRAEAGGGATRLSAGLDFPYGHNALRRGMTAESLALYGELRELLPGLPIRDLPLFCVVPGDRLEELRARFVGAPLRVASGEDLAALRAAWPELLLHPGEVVLAGAVCRHASPAGIVLRLAAELRHAGAELWEGAEVTRLEPAGPEVRLDLADGRSVLARRTVVATGPWAPSGPAGELARREGIRTKKVISLHLSRRTVPGGPVLFFPFNDAFLLPLTERGEVLFSFPCESWDSDPAAGRLSILAEDRRRGLELLARRAPALVPAVHGGRVFCDAYGPDRSPVVAACPELPATVLAGAGSGSGYRLAPALARRALDALAAGGARLELMTGERRAALRMEETGP